MFGFDERFAMFDITPVENLFILEFLPEAKGDYVRVYLYGLMRCYHPEESMTLDRMSHELNLTEDEVIAAYRYWERRGLVRRVSDKPPKWEYLSPKQHAERPQVEKEYEDFARAIYDAFDKVRTLHGSEISSCFEWHEELKLPTEVIIMLLHHMVEVKGRNFRFSDAEKVAVRMAQEKINAIDAAEEFFSRDGSLYAGTRKVLKMLGKHYAPSEAQVGMYHKWIHEWHFSPDTIEAAVELTAKGDPSLPYLDGILKSLKTEYGDGSAVTPETIQLSDQRTESFRKVLKNLGQGTINPETLKAFDRMTELYPMEVIMTAAGECRHSRKGVEDLLQLLEAWHEKGLTTPEQVNSHIRVFHDQTDTIRKLRDIWGLDTGRISQSDRKTLAEWKKSGITTELILYAAPFASEAKQPMSYLGKILSGYQEKGIRTPEEAASDRKNFPAEPKERRGVNAQQYGQRDYSEVQKRLDEERDREMQEFMRANGGESDA